MERVRMALVGCGGMGVRHLAGLSELHASPFRNVDLAAVCDLDRSRAEAAAAKAQELLGVRPAVCVDLEELRRVPEVAMVDVVTDPSVHGPVVCEALEAGLHVLVEKPMAVTVGACRRMIETARDRGRLLSVAENYRRDPSARLIRHLLDRGAVGRLRAAWVHSMSGGDGIFITPWRHLKEKAGPVMDMGVHLADLVRYQLGDVAEVSGAAWIAEPVRRTGEVRVEATAEDSSVAFLRMTSGVAVSWMMSRGGHASLRGEAILGDQGVLTSFGTRGGRAGLHRRGREPVDHGQLLAEAGDFALDPLAAHLFPDRVAAGNTDARLIAIEQHELARAIQVGGAVEVDGLEGLKDVAAVNGILESSLAGRTATMEEIESCALYDYQGEIDQALGFP